MLCDGTTEAIPRVLPLNSFDVGTLMRFAKGRGLFSQMDPSVKVRSNVVSWLQD